MASAWGNSWLSAWGDSWGVIPPDVPPVPEGVGGGGMHGMATSARKRRRKKEEEDFLKIIWPEILRLITGKEK